MLMEFSCKPHTITMESSCCGVRLTKFWGTVWQVPGYGWGGPGYGWGGPGYGKSWGGTIIQFLRVPLQPQQVLDRRRWDWLGIHQHVKLSKIPLCMLESEGANQAGCPKHTSSHRPTRCSRPRWP